MLTISQLKKQHAGSIREQVVLYKGEAYSFFDEGLTRYVFVNESRTKVIKLVIDDYTFFNEEERDIYNNANESTKNLMAKTHFDSGIIEQEFVAPQKFEERPLTIPQMLFHDSCRGEVGWTKDGRLVCYDLDEFKKY